MGSGDKKKICLINPRLEGPYPPLGLAYLASYLAQYAHTPLEINVIDGNCTPDVISAIMEEDPWLVGFTALSPQIQKAVELSCALRKIKPDALQVIGGIHVSAEPEATLQKGAFDCAVLGEGEETFKEVVDAFIAHGRNYGMLRKINGLAFREDSRFVKTDSRAQIQNLDSIPFPARGLLPMKHYLSHYLAARGLTGDRITTLHTSRGCPYDCVFCSCNIVFKGVRHFSVDYVMREIRELVNAYHVKSLFFTDDTFFVNKERIKELCNRLIDEKLNLTVKWEVQGRANLIDQQDAPLLRLMKKAGCVQVDYGFETGSERMLQFLKKKNVSIEFNSRAITVTKEAGLNVMGTFMVGIPGETEDDMRQTISFILDHRDSIDNFQVFVATPYPGAELYQVCKERKLVAEDYFEQLEAEQKKDFRPCYTDTLSCESVWRTQKSLNRLALQKISALEKIRWLIANALRHPLQTCQRAVHALRN